MPNTVIPAIAPESSTVFAFDDLRAISRLNVEGSPMAYRNAAILKEAFCPRTLRFIVRARTINNNVPDLLAFGSEGLLFDSKPCLEGLVFRLDPYFRITDSRYLSACTLPLSPFEDNFAWNSFSTPVMLYVTCALTLVSFLFNARLFETKGHGECTTSGCSQRAMYWPSIYNRQWLWLLSTFKCPPLRYKTTASNRGVDVPTSQCYFVLWNGLLLLRKKS